MQRWEVDVTDPKTISDGLRRVVEHLKAGGRIEDCGRVEDVLRPSVHFCPDGATATVYWAEDESHADYSIPGVTLYRSDKTGQVVGVKILRVREANAEPKRKEPG